MPELPAIFISYAREDLEAASTIAEALRAAGLEVWLDLAELRGGDAWDAKIKHQIRDCTLFLPLISKRTQFRREGYFRLEWHLADERSRLIARGTPFLVPVAIDGTGERDALVPDSFLAVQWTRLPGGATPPAFAERIGSLLRGGSESAARIRPAIAVTAPATSPRRGRRALAWLAAAVAAAAVGVFLWRGRQRPPAPPLAAGEPSVLISSTDFPGDPDLKRAMQLVGSNDAIPEDYGLAEDLAKGVLGQRPTDPDAVTVMAFIENAFIYRGFDRSQQRLASARSFAERAVQLAPNNAYAQGALGVYLFSQLAGADLKRAEQVLDRAIALNPKEPFFYRFRDDALFLNPNVTSADALASAEKTTGLFPGDALSHYELGRHYRDVGRIGDMERELDRTLALAPIVNAMVWKARVALWVRGDPEEMKTILDRIPDRGQSLERVVLGRWIYAMTTGNAQMGLDALDSLPESWVSDYDYIGPKSLLEATLLDAKGQHELARLQCEAALAEVKKREVANPSDLDLLADEVWSLHGLGRDEEARLRMRALNENVTRPYRVGFGNSWWFAPIACNLLLGERAIAVQFMREAASRTNFGAGKVVATRGTEVTRDGYPTSYRQLLYQNMRIDPRMAPWRNDPEIKAILAPTAGTNP